MVLICLHVLYNACTAGGLPGGAGGDEEHDTAGVRGSPQEVTNRTTHTHTVFDLAR